MGDLPEPDWLDRKAVVEAIGFSESTMRRRIADPNMPLEAGVERDGALVWPLPMVELQRREEFARQGRVEEYRPLSMDQRKQLLSRVKYAPKNAAMNPAMLAFLKSAENSPRQSVKKPEATPAEAQRNAKMIQARLAAVPSPRTRIAPNISNAHAPGAPRLPAIDPDALIAAAEGERRLKQGDDGWGLYCDLVDMAREIVERRLDDPVRPDPVMQQAAEALCEMMTASLTRLSRKRYEQRRAAG